MLTVQKLITGGLIVAGLDNDLIRARGIPYATSNRFEVPQQVAPWSTPINCTEPCPICPQLPSRFAAVAGDLQVNRTQSEDCLYLSVTAPAEPCEDGLPVAVWFHGGAYISGAGDLIPYDTAPLAERDMVTVNVNYRLGIFGTQPIPGIAPANLGLQDQIMALQWVRENIAAFGGNPDDVTIFGQSAGADSVYCLLLANGTDNLFKRVIIQSNTWGSRNGDRGPITTELGQKAAEALTGRAQTISVEDLLKLQANLSAISNKPPVNILPFAPVFGEYPLPNESDIDVRLRSLAPEKSILVGSTHDDALPFITSLPNVQRLSKTPIIGSLLVNIAVRIATRYQFGAGVTDFYKKYTSYGGNCTVYLWTYAVPGNPLKACHGMEVPFLLGDWSYWASAPLLKGIDRSMFEELGENVKDLWAAFVQGEQFGARYIRIDGDFNATRVIG